ncbi:hypothetical protein Strain138_002123 [Pseudogemmatithrix spongiicola]|uniref:DUF4304 domain-containing protein n=1 Tax=Pseudogemmatithrix spongiicola TaxID=3062599 RepID=A0AA49Q927_9BACT|nr:hypothetical protein Strain138_002123 [Gemmatimonadaceae bacterium 'strain 138']WKW15720.1 hypothetical protein Strain318_002122 [Gemmatimonadaceae bacterium 'strain 318']
MTKEAPRDVFRAACDALASRLEEAGFRYARSKARATRHASDFSHHVTFHSSRYNHAGHSVVLAISVAIHSDTLCAWRTLRQLPDASGTLLASHLGNLDTPWGWRQWNLADAKSRPVALAESWEQISRVALPLFARFTSAHGALQALLDPENGSVAPVNAIEFAFACERPELAQRYLVELLQVRPRVKELLAAERESRARVPEHARNASIAKQLAWCIQTYDLSLPTAAT